MDQLLVWLVASLGLGLVAACLGCRTCRVLRIRLDEERRRARELSELHLATIEALASAIHAKDQKQHGHVRKVQVYAGALAREIGMDAAEVLGVRTAALLHDIGKLAVPEHILAKPGPLTPEEIEKVRRHSQVGAEIVGSVPFPYPVASLILSHHERWDGEGYPHGLRGEDIPLGARVLFVAEYFDALTSDRPYHRAMTVEAAVEILKKEAGHALDPRLVDTFVRILPDIKVEAERAAASRLQGDGAGATRVPAGPAPGASSPASSVFDDIALAHREIYALYQIARTMGTSLGVSDTMAVIAPRLSGLVPFSACALFVYSEGAEALQCRFASGTDSELLQQLAVKTGQGLIGWVARTRRPLVNARPAAELEAAGSMLETALRSALICPLVFGDRVIGVLAVYHEEPTFYRDDHRRLLDRVCEQAAAVIHNAIVFEQTKQASLTDPLTNLPNTRFLFMHLARELARAERQNSEVALLVADLNDFKFINDSCGHHVGDRALREVAQALRAALRPYDFCVRYAGDEFIVVLSGCGIEEAEQKRLDLKAAIDRICFEEEPGRRLRLSISAGAAVFPHDGRTYEALLAKADSRMYRDKSQRKRDSQHQLGNGVGSHFSSWAGPCGAGA